MERRKPHLDDRGLAAAVAHEVRRWLTPARAYSELALSEPGLSPAAAKALSAILDAAASCQGVLDALVGSVGTGPARVGDLVSESPRGDEWADISPAALEIVLSNVRANANRAAGNEVETLVRSTGNTITIDVIDRGPGMSTDQIASVTKPFVSYSGGSGMGLAICRHLIEAAGGSLRITSAPGKGTCVSIELRRAAAPALRKAS